MGSWIIINRMKQLTAIVHKGEAAEGGFWATCLEVPGANGQGESKEECLEELKEAIQLMLDTEREEAFRLDPQAETAEVSGGRTPRSRRSGTYCPLTYDSSSQPPPPSM